MINIDVYSRKIVLETTLSKEMVFKTLNEFTENFDFEAFSWQRPKTHNFFVGKINLDGFRIIKNIQYRNSWRPLIEGTIHEFPDKTEIEVTMNVHFVVKILSYILFIPFMLILFYNLFSLDKGFIFMFIPLTVAIVSIGTFRYECDSVIHFIKKILNARLID